ncbi:MAG: nucleotidyltransferase domain-containing protein [Promethearchaeota archaeon]|nr:MAG: nucleotidyltransferase domain-containing protein [Candidatus Lokiarchaeota archaeon]
MTDPWIKKFQQETLPKIIAEFNPQKIILFGSRVRGDARKDSDIDVIIIASQFEKIPFLKRMPFLLKQFPFPKHIDYLCYTPQEYEKIKNTSSLIIDALENAIEIT